MRARPPVPGPSGRAVRLGVLIVLVLPGALGLGVTALVLSGQLSTALGLAVMVGTIMAASVATMLAISHARRRVETTQQSEIAWLRAMCDTTGAASMVFDAAGRAVFSNHLAEELTGPSGGPERWLRDTRFFVPGTLAPLTGARHPGALLGGHSTKGHHHVGWLDPGRGERALRLSVHPVDDVPGRGRITILTVTDESKSWPARDHIARLERLEAVGLMAASASHEFGNIFGALQLTADVGMLQHEGTAQAQFHAVSEACQRGTQMTQRLLELSNDGTIPSEPLELTALLGEVQSLLNAALGGEAGLSLDLPDQPVTVTANRADLVAAVMRLVLNGRDAIRDRPGTEPMIWLGLCTGDGTAVLTVRDAGEGMNAETLARATTPFYTSRETGAGLGLSMVDNFAKRSGGSLTLDSKPASGTRAAIRLPLVGAQVLPGAAPHPLPDLAHLNLLVVEDDPQFRDALLAALLSLGARVTHETTAEAALARLKAAERYDLLLSGLRLPGAMSGLDLARVAAKRVPEIAILLMIGYDEKMPRRCDETGALVLRKPMRLELLINAIRIVRPQARAPSRALHGATDPTPPQTSQ